MKYCIILASILVLAATAFVIVVKGKKALAWVSFGIALAFGGFLVAVGMFVNAACTPQKTFLGKNPLYICSASMSPTVEKGSIVYVEAADTAELKVGDVIAYYYEYQLHEDGTLTYSPEKMTVDRIAAVMSIDSKRFYMLQGDSHTEPYRAQIPEGVVYGVLDAEAGFPWNLIAKVKPLFPRRNDPREKSELMDPFEWEVLKEAIDAVKP